MWAKWTVAAMAAVCLTGCVSNPSYRPCGPGFLNNLFVPQGFAGVDFRRACQRHDDCYGAGCDRKACDDRFLNDMLGACECSDCPCMCRLKAWQWYWQVRLFGGFSYGNSGFGGGGHGCGCNGCGRNGYGCNGCGCSGCGCNRCCPGPCGGCGCQCCPTCQPPCQDAPGYVEGP